ncbi:MAG: hypothetical protein K2J89_01825 [Clostridia bacterium]|nr:hypothetical protein [Clostridia bacterium]
MFYLQNRWKLENGRLRYYGLRNKPYMFKNVVKLTKSQERIVKNLPCELSDAEIKTMKDLIGKQVVKSEELRATPKSLKDARFCKTCIANDFIIAGLEFDKNGQCPMCATKNETKHLKSVVPVKNTFEHSKKSRFDVAVFYTGGKDSTYLLYYLSKVLDLKVLALTWELPFMSNCARQSIEGAKKSLSNVEFIIRKVADEDLKKIYKRLYSTAGNTCACPSLAYILFYPELVANKVPYFVAGNEPAQLVGLYYNHMAPKIAYTFGNNKFLNAIINLGRILTLRPPLKRGQFHTLATMRQLAYGDNFIKNLAGYGNQLVQKVVDAIHQVPSIVKPLKRAIRSSSLSGNIPAFVQVDLNEICGGHYDWRKIKDLIISQCGWVAPEKTDKGLHTSCNIEKCKEYSQFIRFYNMESNMIPFSALEISLASRDKAITREEAIAELNSALGFSLDEPPECAITKEYIK